ncbi:MAG: rod-binding protein [Devosia sp.]|uniref:rod-binding protein n=1 Tax=Devosia sp. TaxID=1871048 RepID=UPI001A4A1104|nr:rod-binding protein [Devosia sp.]MBL8596833.1 rod-binding protein [Devosia sp.]
MSTIPIAKLDTSVPGYDKLRKQAVELEGVFLTTLMKEMFSSIDTSESSFGGGFAEETWRGMQAEQFAGALAETGGIGLADQLMGDLLRLQEANS